MCDYLYVIGMEWFNSAKTLVTIFIVGEYGNHFIFIRHTICTLILITLSAAEDSPERPELRSVVQSQGSLLGLGEGREERRETCQDLP